MANCYETDRGLPIPDFKSVKEVYRNMGIGGSFATTVSMIMPDHNAGNRARYSVVRIYRTTGEILTIGRELSLSQARKVAKD